MIKVSILVPVYKCEKFINQCVESLFSQAFDDVEFIFYDDCSPDASVSLIHQCLEKHPDRWEQVRIISAQQNSGVSIARNRLLVEAKGEYIWYVDSDDWIEPDAIRLLYETACSSKAGIVSFGFYYEGISRCATVYHYKYKSVKECLKDVIGNNWGAVWRFFFRRSIATENSILFPVGYNVAEDYVFCIKYLFHVQNIISIDVPLYHHITYNTMSLVATQDIHSLVHQYEATIIVEDFLRKNKILQLYSKDLNLRKAYVLASFYRYFNRIWGGLYGPLWKRLVARWKRKAIALIYKHGLKSSK